MPTTKNGFQISNLHPKKHGLKKSFWGMVICVTFTQIFKRENSLGFVKYDY